MISNKLQVKWELQADYVQIELIGKMREDQYMAFGLSGAQNRPQMVSFPFKHVTLCNGFLIDNLFDCMVRWGLMWRLHSMTPCPQFFALKIIICRNYRNVMVNKAFVPMNVSVVEMML